jgi:hypothetical protein
MAMSSCVLRSPSVVLHLPDRLAVIATPRVWASPVPAGVRRPYTVVRARDYWIYAAAPAA